MNLCLIIVIGAALQTTIAAITVLPTNNVTSTHHTITQQHRTDNGSHNIYLWKRRGHGSGGRGGGRSSSRSGSSGSPGRGAASSSSSAGGRTTTGSGVAPAYGNGRFYSGGATIPYRAGSPSTGGVVPFMLAGGLQEIEFWPGGWHQMPYLYPHKQPWYYHNQTSDSNKIRLVLYGCTSYQVYGYNNADQAYIDSIIGNGSYGSLNHTIVCLGEVNGTEAVLINGTLPNGTTASGGRKSPNAAASLNPVALVAGWWPALVTTALMAFVG